MAHILCPDEIWRVKQYRENCTYWREKGKPHEDEERMLAVIDRLVAEMFALKEIRRAQDERLEAVGKELAEARGLVAVRDNEVARLKRWESIVKTNQAETNRTM